RADLMAAQSAAGRAGRVSVPQLPGGGRPEPPEDLTKREAELWPAASLQPCPARSAPSASDRALVTRAGLFRWDIKKEPRRDGAQNLPEDTDGASMPPNRSPA